MCEVHRLDSDMCELPWGAEEVDVWHTSALGTLPDDGIRANGGLYA